MSDREIICGYQVHPAASVFPLLAGDEFDELVDSVRKNGILHPVVVRNTPDGDELIDGRNRLRAAEVVRMSGHRCDVPVTHWDNAMGNVCEWIWETNATRRQLTDDAVTLASAAIWPLIKAENRARQEATQFPKGESGNPSGKKQVTTNPSLPAQRDRKADDARSTVGQVAAKAGTSMHKARQAVAVQKAIESGAIPAAAAQEVMAGKKKLRDVAPKPERPQAAPRHRSMKVILEDLRDLIAEWMNADHNTEVLRDELKVHYERLGE